MCLETKLKFRWILGVDMDLEQWTFFVLPTARIDERLGDQGSLGLSTLNKLSPDETDFNELAGAIHRAAANH